jgi:hypothetical protein
MGTVSTQGSDSVIHLKVSNPNREVALLTHLQLRNSINGRRILPVYYSDNYVSLLPGEKRSITIRASRSVIGVTKPVIAVDGWNVTCRAAHYKDFSVAPNNAAGFAHDSVVQNIDCGVGWLPSYAADCYYTGGNQETCDEQVTTSGIAFAAPPLLYRTDRHGPCEYAIPATPGGSYTVRLHFAETYYTAPREREFNVFINRVRVLKNFDIFAAAGGKDRALVEDFPGIHPNSQGEIDVKFTTGAVDQPTICGIQIVPQLPTTKHIPQ